MMSNYGKEPKLKVIIDDDTYGTVEVPTGEYITSTLKTTTVTLESSITALEDKISTKMETQAETFKRELEERDNKIKRLVNELNEISKLNTHLIKYGAKIAHCDIIAYEDIPVSIFKSPDVVKYKALFKFINDSYNYDEYEFKLDDIRGNDVKVKLCKLKRLNKDRIQVKIKVYNSSNSLIKKLKYIVDIKGKKYIQL